MMTEEKREQMTIKDAEDIGLLFNCLSRQYLADYDAELLHLMHRIVDRYLGYFSPRTLICTIQDLAQGKRSVFCQVCTERPEEQAEEYAHLLKRLVRRYWSIQLNDSIEPGWVNKDGSA